MRKIDNKLVEQWKSMPRNKEASDFYDQHIFPDIIDVFKQKQFPEKDYDGLILTVGFSPQPLILSINAINPNQVAFLYTSEVEHFIEIIQEQTGYNDDSSVFLNIDGKDVRDIYNLTWNFARDTWKDFKNIIVDITGGKAFMGAGAALAAAIIPADICYVDCDDYLKEFRMPEPGREYMRILEGPDTLLQIAR